MTDKKFERIIFLIALVWYMITAYFSVGYYHADEHYQIIEFARLTSGANLPSDLSWEFHDKIRPALQPVLCFILFKAFNFFSVSNPYVQAFLLRLITALMAVFIISYFSRACRSFISTKLWRIFYFLSYFIWFLPWINVRFSSETYSGLLFLLVLAIIINGKKSTGYYLLIGALLGLSFIFRFQTIALSFGLIAWLLFVKKENIKSIGWIVIAFAGVVLAGVMTDCWYYGTFVFTPWNYFHADIVKDVVPIFGTSPWYYYFYYIFRFSFFPFGILILFSFLFLLYKMPKSIFIWSVVPFLIIHSIIPHKEIRFLFPIVNLVPVVLVLAYQEFRIKDNLLHEKSKMITGSVFLILVGINMIGVLVASIKPAGIGNMKIGEIIHERNTCNNSILIETNNSDPYDPWAGLVAKFYLEKNMRRMNLKSINGDSIVANDSCTFFIVKSKNMNDPEVATLLREQHFVKIAESIPEWMHGILKIYGGFDMESILILYQKKY